MFIGFLEKFGKKEMILLKYWMHVFLEKCEITALDL